MTRIHQIRCVGCGRINGRDVDMGPAGWAYTCRCGAQTSQFDGRLSFPASLWLSRKGWRDIPHIEYYLGWSEFMDDVKKSVINQLRLAGSISVEECKECQSRRPADIARFEDAIKHGWCDHMDELSAASHFSLPLKVIRTYLPFKANQ